MKHGSFLNSLLGRVQVAPEEKMRSVAPTIEEQNALFETYRQHGIIDGTPGRVDDRTIHRACEQIRRDYDSGKINNDQAYARADALYPTIDNNHARGIAAHHAHEEVSRLLDHILKDC